MATWHNDFSASLWNKLQTTVFKNGITINSHHNRFSLQNRCPKLTVLDLTGTNIRKLNVEKLQVQISFLKRFLFGSLHNKGFLKKCLKVNCFLLQTGCPRLKELFLANLLLHSTPTSTEVVCNKLNVTWWLTRMSSTFDLTHRKRYYTIRQF